MNRLCGLALVLVVLAGCSKAPPSAQQPVVQLPDPPVKGEVVPKEEGTKKPEPRNIVVVTPAAAAQVQKLSQQHGGAGYLRVSVNADNEYKLDLDPQMDPKDDILIESQGVKVVVDRKTSLLLPPGIKVDYVASGKKTGFKFISPEEDAGPADTSVSLVEARRGFKTTLVRRESGGEPAPVPPPNVFRLVKYDAPPGKLTAYLSPDPKDGKKHPAIVWITGGDCNSIGPVWAERPVSNDQSASAYRKAGIVMMFPALRGGNDNPGIKEGFLGEVDDVVAAAEFLRKQPYVDPDRVYLGGHSTGGTLVLLTAECSDRFRAVFSFGPVSNVLGYGPNYRPFALSEPKEAQLRTPGRWLHSIRAPVFVFEGTEGGNVDSLQSMARSSKNPKVQFFEIRGANHFDLLAPTNRLIAEKILRDTGPTCNLAFTEVELNKPFVK
jgi:Fe-S cluster assembly iron-binding protein IscA/dienelactone hydrolase